LTKQDNPGALFQSYRSEEPEKQQVQLPLMPFPEQVMHNYARLGVSFKAQRQGYSREKLTILIVVKNGSLKELRD
jgi:hypothetical protein